MNIADEGNEYFYESLQNIEWLKKNIVLRNFRKNNIQNSLMFRKIED